TACFLRRSQLPFDFDTDRECLEQCLLTCWQPDVSKVRLALVANTLEVAELWVSATLVAEARDNPNLAVDGELRALPFDSRANLNQELPSPHSVRGRRKSK